MSTLNVSNITDGTTTVGTSYVVNGAAKAWVNFNGTGTVAIRDSMNVGSLTDNGTGSYSFSMSNSMSASDYSSVNTANNYGGCVSSTLAATPNDATVTRIYTWNSTPSLVDVTHVNALNSGDLA